MRPAFYSNPLYKQKQSKITRRSWKNGKLNHLIKPLETRFCKNPDCKLSFEVKPYSPKIYCSRSCAAHITNTRRFKKVNICLNCIRSTKRFMYKYCSIKCQIDTRYSKYIERWKKDLETGNRGINTKNISKHLRRYLQEKYGDKCSVCTWSQVHPVTKVVPLEIDHIDGNSENNKEENLRLICPNCHSLTSSFRNLNKGKGRAWRLKYLKTSYSNS